MHHDADELTGFAAPEVHLIAGPEVHAAVVEAGPVLAGVRLIRTDDFGGAASAVLGEHEIELELDILELRLRDKAAAALTRRRLSADNDAVLNRPANICRVLRRRARRCAAAGRDDPAAEIEI